MKIKEYLLKLDELEELKNSIANDILNLGGGKIDKVKIVNFSDISKENSLSPNYYNINFQLKEVSDELLRSEYYTLIPKLKSIIDSGVNKNHDKPNVTKIKFINELNPEVIKLLKQYYDENF